MSSHIENSTQKFTKVIESQGQKGIEKYGQPMDPLDSNYDWLEMAVEEQVDGFQYLVAEQAKRKFVVAKIRRLIDCKGQYADQREIIFWLDVLEGKN